MISSAFGKIVNEHGELVAEGACEVDDDRGSVTMRPVLDMPLLERQRGTLRLTLDDGSEVLLTDRVIHFKVNLPGQRPGSVYRMYIAGQQGLARWPSEGSGDLEARPEPAEWVARGGAGGDGSSSNEQRASSNEGGIAGSEHDPSRNPNDLPPELRKDDQP